MCFFTFFVNILSCCYLDGSSSTKPAIYSSSSVLPRGNHHQNILVCSDLTVPIY